MLEGGGGGETAGGVEGEERSLLKGALLARMGEAMQEKGDLQGAEDAFTKSLEAYHDDDVLAGWCPSSLLRHKEIHS